MVKGELLSKLNEQINLENSSANLYLSMSAWCSSKGYKGSAMFLFEHSKEELEHMRRLFNYVNETGSVAKITAIDAPETEFETLKNVFETTFKHEQKITAKINDLVDVALSTKDFSTFKFLQWYVGEQHEEEALFKEILNLFDVIGTDGRGLFMIDREIEKIQANRFKK